VTARFPKVRCRSSSAIAGPERIVTPNLDGSRFQLDRVEQPRVPFAREGGTLPARLSFRLIAPTELKDASYPIRRSLLNLVILFPFSFTLRVANEAKTLLASSSRSGFVITRFGRGLLLVGCTLARIIGVGRGRSKSEVTIKSAVSRGVRLRSRFTSADLQ